jgi:hypothetical protein
MELGVAVAKLVHAHSGTPPYLVPDGAATTRTALSALEVQLLAAGKRLGLARLKPYEEAAVATLRECDAVAEDAVRALVAYETADAAEAAIADAVFAHPHSVTVLSSALDAVLGAIAARNAAAREEPRTRGRTRWRQPRA